MRIVFTVYTHSCSFIRKCFYLTTHSTHFIYGYMASDIWLRTILIVRKETCCHHIGYSFRLTARVLLYAPSYRQDSTYHGLCYTSRGALAWMRNSSMGSPHEGLIRWPIAQWANTLTTELHLAPSFFYPYFCMGSQTNFYIWDGIRGVGHSSEVECLLMELFLVHASAPRLV